MLRWLLRGGILAGLALSFVVACSAESHGGPPTAPCSDQVKGTAPVCGKVCANKCGCSECQPGSQTFIEGILYVCSGKCFSLATGTGGTSSGGTSSGGTSSGGAAGSGNTGGNPSGGGSGGSFGGSAGAGDGG